MVFVDVTTRRHRRRLFMTFIIKKPYSVISVGAIIGQADNVMLHVMQSIPVHPNSPQIAVSDHFGVSLNTVVSDRLIVASNDPFICKTTRVQWFG